MTELSKAGFGSLAPVRAVLPLILGIAGAALLAGCKDAAEADYKRCEQLEAQGKLEEAAAACRAASAADRSSRFGEQATKKEIKLLDAIQARKQADVARAASQADQAKIQDAESKVQWVLESTPPKDPQGLSEKCMAMSRDFENAYSCTPKDPSAVPPGQPVPFLEECTVLANAKGCKPFNPDVPSPRWCCTK